MLLSAPELTNPGTGLFLEAHVAQHLARLDAAWVEAPKQRDRLEDTQLLLETGFLKLDTQPLAQPPPVALPALSQNLDLAPVGFEESLQDLHRSRLSGPVGPQKTEAFPALNFEVESVHRHDVVVALDQTLAA